MVLRRLKFDRDGPEEPVQGHVRLRLGVPINGRHMKQTQLLHHDAEDDRRAFASMATWN